MAALSLPFEGLAGVWVVIFTIGFAVITGMFAWTAVLFIRARREIARPTEAPENGAHAFYWVFLVPALNEEVTIRDSVSRLMAIPVARRLVVVIDDGSTDRTPAILAELSHPELHVLRREPPDARRGKAAALNNAYRDLGGILGPGIDRDGVIVVIVDADGRLDTDAPRFAAAQFEDRRVGGVQARVRIYNRHTLLTWFQDVEFAVLGRLYQLGRSGWGTAGMGGNGQFNRLSSLDAVADREGPWRDRLTEDQDLGLRLIGAGWLGRQEDRAVVNQQGLSSLRRLLRQRTRWTQGNLQALGLIGVVRRAPVGFFPRLDLLAYLLIPLWQSIVGVCLVAAIVLAVTGAAGFWSADVPWWQLVFFYLLGYGGIVLGCIARGAPKGTGGAAANWLIAHPYALYTWLIWPVLVRATLRQLTDRRGWAKTAREPIPAKAGRGGSRAA
jgi:1,2-diacylglycerol 3-beta-glucosyltransferase